MSKYRSRIPHRKAHPKIWVWSHTEKAEINYFQEFKNHLHSNLLMPRKFICYTPQQLIPKVVEWKNREINDEDRDKVWCIFDVDDFFKNDPQNLLKAIELAHQNSIMIGYINECFEHWVLLHFEKLNSKIDRGATIEKKINQHFKKNGFGKYEKNQKVFKPLLLLQNNAIKNAACLVPVNYEEIDWPKVLGSDGNPSTSIHFLVKEINDLQGS